MEKHQHPIVAIKLHSIYNLSMIETLTHTGTETEIITTLNSAIIEAHKQDENALGVIVFGGRTHPNMTRPNSDIDIICVQESVSVRTDAVLQKLIRERLNRLNITLHYHGTIYADWINSRFSTQDFERTNLLNDTIHRCLYVDQKSLFIINRSRN